MCHLPKCPVAYPLSLSSSRDCRATIKPKVTDPTLEAARMPTGHEAYSAGLTGDARGVEPGEPCPAFGEAVDMGRFRIGMAVATKVAVTQVIGEDENDVRRHWLCKSTAGKEENERRNKKSRHAGSSVTCICD